MKRILTLLLCLALAAALCACGKEAESFTPPTVEYSDIELFSGGFTDETPDAPTAKLRVLELMDEGYTVDALAAFGEYVLAADTGISYELVLARLDYKNGGVSDRRVLLSSEQSGNKYGEKLCSVCTGNDGCFYVLFSEQPRYSNNLSEYKSVENPLYSGKASIIKLSREGELLGSLALDSLPGDGADNIRAGNDGNILISCNKCEYYEPLGLYIVGSQYLVELSMDEGIKKSRLLEGNAVCSDILFCGDNILARICSEAGGAIYKLNDDLSLGDALADETTIGFGNVQSGSYGEEFVFQQGSGFSSYSPITGQIQRLCSISELPEENGLVIGFIENATCILVSENVLICSAYNWKGIAVYTIGS